MLSRLSFPEASAPVERRRTPGAQSVTDLLFNSAATRQKHMTVVGSWEFVRQSHDRSARGLTSLDYIDRVD